jgi:hypothetical protein
MVLDMIYSRKIFSFLYFVTSSLQVSLSIWGYSPWESMVVMESRLPIPGQGEGRGEGNRNSSSPQWTVIDGHMHRDKIHTQWFRSETETAP